VREKPERKMESLPGGGREITSDLGVPLSEVDIDALTPHTALPHTRLSIVLDACVGRVGDAASWLWVVLLGVIVTNVVMRYALGEGRIEFEELQWHLYSVGFLVGLSYCVVSDDHVRVDFIHGNLGPRAQAWIELYGILLLLLPFVALVTIYSVPFVQYSFASSEISASAGGLPYRWLIKSTLCFGFGLLGLAAVARLSRVASFLFGAPRSVSPPSEPGR
jgi:TRAP-type mannitol/chloroaromatic compound transport system permease small subunit